MVVLTSVSISKENLMNIRSRLNRRDFLKTGGAGLATFAVLDKHHSAVGAQTVTGSQRQIFPLNHNWLYSEKVLPDGTKPAFNDSRFVRVTIPHTNKMLPWHGFDDKEFHRSHVPNQAKRQHRKSH